MTHDLSQFDYAGQYVAISAQSKAAIVRQGGIVEPAPVHRRDSQVLYPKGTKEIGTYENSRVRLPDGTVLRYRHYDGPHLDPVLEVE